MSVNDTYSMPPDGWVCFHCGERFTTPGAARDHFGERPDDGLACRIKAGEECGLVMAMRSAQRERDEMSEVRARLLTSLESERSWRTEVQRQRDEASLNIGDLSKLLAAVRDTLDGLRGHAFATEADQQLVEPLFRIELDLVAEQYQLVDEKHVVVPIEPTRERLERGLEGTDPLFRQRDIQIRRHIYLITTAPIEPKLED